MSDPLDPQSNRTHDGKASLVHRYLLHGDTIDTNVLSRAEALQLEFNRLSRQLLEQRRATGGLFVISLSWHSDLSAAMDEFLHNGS